MTNIAVPTPAESLAVPSVQPPALAVPAGTIQVPDTTLAGLLASAGWTCTAPGTPPVPPLTRAGIGLWNNGTSAAALGVVPAWYLTYADGADSTVIDSLTAAAFAGQTVVMRIGKVTAAQATAMAQELKVLGATDAVIAPMWEYNQHGWFSLWNQTALTVAEFQAEWEVIVNAMRAVCPTLRFALVSTADPKTTQNDLPGRSEFDTFLAGTDALGLPWVNIVGIDCYDNNGSVAASQACIQSVSLFATSKGLAWAIFEWGPNNNVANDDPAFVNMIATVTATPGCLFQSLFSQSGTPTDITKLPNMLAAYKANFG